MIRDTDADWSKIASENPYWGVLSHRDYLGTDLQKTVKERFLLSGQTQFDNLLSFIHHHIEPDFRIRRGLDFGCGVGRILIPLAKHAEEAIGVDVAPGMLDSAQANLNDQGIDNAYLVPGDETLSRVSGTFNFVNSYMVLQHIQPDRGLRLIRRLLQILEVNGIFLLHITYANERNLHPSERGCISYYRRSGHELISVESEVPEGSITMFEYDLNEVLAVVGNLAGDTLFMMPTNHGGHIGVQILGKKTRELSA